MGKESITLSIELAITHCYEFECLENNYSLTISTQECRIITNNFNTRRTYILYIALKHSIRIRQHKLDLNLSKTKQPLPTTTNSHLNFRYLTASANL